MEGAFSISHSSAMARRSAGVLALSSERFKRSTVMEYLWADQPRGGAYRREVWDGKCDGPDGPAKPHLIGVFAKVNQKRVMTAKTMTSIRIVGTSFISR